MRFVNNRSIVNVQMYLMQLQPSSNGCMLESRISHMWNTSFTCAKYLVCLLTAKQDIGDFLVSLHTSHGNMLGVLHSMGVFQEEKSYQIFCRNKILLPLAVIDETAVLGTSGDLQYGAHLLSVEQ